MIHTFELSKTMSRELFNIIIQSLGARIYSRNCWVTSAYADKGFQLIRLYKFQRKEIKTKIKEDSDLTHHYMIALSINTANMFGGNGDPHLPQSILSFTSDYVRAIYRKIFELIPCLEEHPEWCFDSCWDEAEQRNIAGDEEWINQKKELDKKWFERNVFKARRIDYAFDLNYMQQQYLTLINRGYSLRKKAYERSYFEDTDIQEESTDDEPDIPDIPDSEEILEMLADKEKDVMNNEEISDSKYHSDVNYVYYKGKGANINIYHKATEIQKENLSFDPYENYDFLRIEVQVKKSKLNYIISQSKEGKLIDIKLKGRELQYLILPEVEHYILDYYVNGLTGAGLYVTYDRAMKIIDDSKYTKSKKERLKKVIEAVAKKHGIAKVLEQVENGMITDLGKLSTVKQYLREIHKELGINPVTIPARMEVPKMILENQSGGKDLPMKALPSLVDILTAYGDQMKDYQQNGRPVTDDELKEIDKL